MLLILSVSGEFSISDTDFFIVSLWGKKEQKTFSLSQIIENWKFQIKPKVLLIWCALCQFSCRVSDFLWITLNPSISACIFSTPIKTLGEVLQSLPLKNSPTVNSNPFTGLSGPLHSFAESPTQTLKALIIVDYKSLVWIHNWKPGLKSQSIQNIDKHTQSELS